MTIKLHKRDQDKSVDFYRKQDLVPGTIYGSKSDTASIYTNFNEISIAFKKSEGQLAEFEIDGKKVEGILKECQFEPTTSKIVHFDIYIPELDKPVITSVPLIFIGVEELEKQGLVVNKNLDEIEIESLPRNIPENIVVDLSSLTEAHQSLFVKDLKLPNNLKVTIPEETPVVSILETAQE
ncbi:MAG: 50S ribosomal protein L25 [Patescibacteria group bacterium]